MGDAKSSSDSQTSRAQQLCPNDLKLVYEALLPGTSHGLCSVPHPHTGPGSRSDWLRGSPTSWRMPAQQFEPVRTDSDTQSATGFPSLKVATLDCREQVQRCTLDGVDGI